MVSRRSQWVAVGCENAWFVVAYSIIVHADYPQAAVLSARRQPPPLHRRRPQSARLLQVCARLLQVSCCIRQVAVARVQLVRHSLRALRSYSASASTIGCVAVRDEAGVHDVLRRAHAQGLRFGVPVASMPRIRSATSQTFPLPPEPS